MWSSFRLLSCCFLFWLALANPAAKNSQLQSTEKSHSQNHLLLTESDSSSISSPTSLPTSVASPTWQPTRQPSSDFPTFSPPTLHPTSEPTKPTFSPSTRRPSPKPSLRPSRGPTLAPSSLPTTIRPSCIPTVLPTRQTQTELMFEISCIVEENTQLNSLLLEEELTAIISAEAAVLQMSSTKFRFLAQIAVHIVNSTIIPSTSRSLSTSNGFQVFNELKISLVDFPELNNNVSVLYAQLLDQAALINNRSLLTSEIRRVGNSNQLVRLKSANTSNLELSLPLVIQSPTYYPTFAPTKGKRSVGVLSTWEFAIVICFSVVGFVFILLVFRFSDRIYVTKNYRVSSSYEQEQDGQEGKVDQANPYMTPSNFLAHNKGYDEFLDSQFVKAKNQKKYKQETKRLQKLNTQFKRERSEKPKSSGMSTSTVLYA